MFHRYTHPRFGMQWFVLVVLFGVFALSMGAETAVAQATNDLRISQVYGGGGNAGATYTHDFIEIFNSGSNTIDLTNWTVQYAPSTGTTWTITNLNGSIESGQYYLVQQAQGSGGTTSLPTPDASGSINMNATSGKVALVNSNTALSNDCPTNITIVDFVGYGSANCFEGSATSNLSNTTAALRNANGCSDTNTNSVDFTISAPVPRNSSSPTNNCATYNTITVDGNLSDWLVSKHKLGANNPAKLRLKPTS